MDDFNQFANGRFARTQPEEWKRIPFDGSSGRLWLKVAGIALLWIVILTLSLWSIAQQGT